MSGLASSFRLIRSECARMDGKGFILAKKKNRKIVRYRKPFHMNIGIFIFGIIFIYVMYFVFRYFTAAHVSIYEVAPGALAENRVFQGLILRDEAVYYASEGGYVHYYCRDGSKVSVGSCIYSLADSADYYQRMAAENDGELKISDESYQQLENVMGQFMEEYSDGRFQKAYQFRYDLEAVLMDAMSSGARQADGGEAPGGLRSCNAENAGVVVYYMDGLEAVTTESFTADMFDSQSYQKENFVQREAVAAGDAVYKMIHSENWQTVVPVPEDLALDLAEDLTEGENIQVRFLKDDTTAWASTELTQRDGAWYLILRFWNSMIRFATDRYVNLELLINDSSGLKIPNSAIATKEFFTVPKEYVSKGGDSDQDGVLREYKTEEGNTVVEFTPVVLFYETEDRFYIDSEALQLGDMALRPDSDERWMLKDIESLEGVYNVNKGYAVFRRIEKLFGNEEYTIISDRTPYGISMYDHIALDSGTVRENAIIN